MSDTLDPQMLAPGGLLIYCDGGLANRVNSLLGGMVLAERLRRPYRVLWPRNNRCGAGFHELFNLPVTVHELPLQALVPQQARLQLWLHENDVGFTEPVTALRSLPAPQAQATLDTADGRAILYCENTVLAWLPDADVQRAVLRLRFNEAVLAPARATIAAQAPGGYVGIHLRGTDFNSPPPTEAMLATVQQNPGTPFFVCSDDPLLEARFAALPNAFTHGKTAHVAKLQQGPWRAPVTDSDGLPYSSNIDRNGPSVLQAAVDLLLLAGSTPVRTSGSTFLALAERLRTSGWAAQQLSPAAAQAAVREPFTSQQEVLDLLALLRPQQMVTDHKVRIGGDADGGYVMPSLALRSTAVVSIGIGDQVSFDAELADRGATVLQFDHTIPGQPMAHERFRFHSLGWGPQDDGPLRSTHTMMRGVDWQQAQHAILKFDVEGAEWDALIATTSDDLARFDVIAGEFHGFHNLGVRSFYDQVHAVLAKINATHVPVHLHPNNATGIRLVQGVPVPPLMEITFVRRGLVATAGPSTDPIPGPLDRPNMADRPEICLRVY